jgi:hypothetical protein
MGDQSPLFEQRVAIFLGEMPNWPYQITANWRWLEADAV